MNPRDVLKAVYACPRCGSTDVRLSDRSGGFAIFLTLFSLHPYRCAVCDSRFFRTAGKDHVIDMEELHREAAPAGRQTQVSEAQVSEKFARLMKTEHWLRSYITDLLGAHEIGNGLDFHTAELLLKQEKESFETDLVLAQRMYRMYPHLFRQEGEAAKQGQ